MINARSRIWIWNLKGIVTKFKNLCRFEGTNMLRLMVVDCWKIIG